MTQDGKESTLSRWSRRKLESQQAEVQPPTLPEPEPEQNAAAVEAEEKPVLTDSDMHDIDSINE